MIAYLTALLSGPSYDLPDFEPAAGPSGVVSRSSLRADSIENPFTFIGGAVDKGAVARPSKRDPLSQIELAWLYQQSGLARKIVMLYPREEIRGGWTVKDSTTKVNPLRSEERRLSIFQRIQEARWKERLRGGSVLYPVIDDGQPLTMPLNVEGIQRIENIVVYERVEAQAMEWEGDPHSPLYNQVRMWLITPVSAGSALPFRIHASRVIHFPGEAVTAEERWTNGGHGQSVLEAAWDAVRNRSQLSSAGASLVQELIVPVITINDLDAKATGDEGLAFHLRMRLMAQARSLLNMVMLGQNETFKRDPISITGFEDLAECAKEDLAAATDIPVTKLFSPPASGLGANSEGDRESWAEAVHASAHIHLYERLITLYSWVYAQKEGPTNGVVPDEWDVEFGSLDRPSAKTQAEIDETTARADTERIASGVVSADEVRKHGSSEKAIAAINLEDEDDEETEDDPVGEGIIGADGRGMQMRGLLDLVDAVRQGNLTPDGAEAILMASYPAIGPEAAARIVAGAQNAPNAGEQPATPGPNAEPAPAK